MTFFFFFRRKSWGRDANSLPYHPCPNPHTHTPPPSVCLSTVQGQSPESHAVSPSLHLVLEKAAQLFPKWLHCFAFPSAVYGIFLSLPILTGIWCCQCFWFWSNRCVVVHLCFSLQLPNDIWHKEFFYMSVCHVFHLVRVIRTFCLFVFCPFSIRFSYYWVLRFPLYFRYRTVSRYVFGKNLSRHMTCCFILTNSAFCRAETLSEVQLVSSQFHGLCFWYGV